MAKEAKKALLKKAVGDSVNSPTLKGTDASGFKRTWGGRYEGKEGPVLTPERRTPPPMPAEKTMSPVGTTFGPGGSNVPGPVVIKKGFLPATSQSGRTAVGSRFGLPTEDLETEPGIMPSTLGMQRKGFPLDAAKGEILKKKVKAKIGPSDYKAPDKNFSIR